MPEHQIEMFWKHVGDLSLRVKGFQIFNLMASQYRKTPRANWIDYERGTFFITICTQNKIHYFGNIYNEEMHLSEIGKIVDYHINNVKKFCEDIEVPLFVIMPNHIHLIINVGTSLCDVSIKNPKEQRIPNPSLRGNATCQRHVPTLSRYIRSFKASVTKEARKINPHFAWQSRYHDHLIRGNKDGNKIAEYIENNVLNWEADCFYEFHD